MFAETDCTTAQLDAAIPKIEIRTPFAPSSLIDNVLKEQKMSKQAARLIELVAMQKRSYRMSRTNRLRELAIAIIAGAPVAYTKRKGD